MHTIHGSLSKKRERLLLVSDDAGYVYVIKAILSFKAPFPFKLDCVGTLKEALAQLRVRPYNLILLDLRLPDSDAIEALKAIRHSYAQIPVIAIVDQNDDNLAVAAMKEGIQDLLSKNDLNGRLLVLSIRFAIEQATLASQRNDFIAAIVHDLKNPLVGSNRVFDLILEEHLGPVQPELRDLIVLLKNSNNNMVQMLRNLLDIYRYDVGAVEFQFENVDLMAILDGAAQELGPLASSKNIRLEVNDGGEPVPVLADELAIRRVLLNIIGNSIKYTPSGGWVKVTLTKDSEVVQVEVRDNGEGIDPKEQTRLFQRFYRGVRNDATGSGLGLFVCRQILDAHQGSIRCQSDVGQGSVFSIELPKVLESVDPPTDLPVRQIRNGDTSTSR